MNASRRQHVAVQAPPPSPGTRLERVKTISEIVSTWVGLAALLVGGIFALVEYQAHRRETRDEKTIEFFKQWSLSSTAVAYATVSKVLDGADYEKKWDELERPNRNDPDALAPEKPLGGLVVATIQQNELAEPIYRVNDYFAALMECADAEVCNAELTQRLFCHLVVPFEQNTRSFTTLQRRTDRSYGRGMLRLAALCADKKNGSGTFLQLKN